jgi:AcrR family transcriptional regulator
LAQGWTSVLDSDGGGGAPLGGFVDRRLQLGGRVRDRQQDQPVVIALVEDVRSGQYALTGSAASVSIHRDPHDEVLPAIFDTYPDLSRYLTVPLLADSAKFFRVQGFMECNGCFNGGMTDRVDGLRERKKQATKLALSSAAIRLCLLHGVENVTVDDIAAEADVSPRTFFNYFACKEDAIVEESRSRSERLIGRLRSRPADEPICAAVRAALLLLVQDVTADSKQWVAELKMLHQTPSLLPYQLGSYVAMERSLAEMIAERTRTDVERDMYPRLLAGITVAGVRVALNQWLTSADQTPVTDYVNHAFDQLEPAFQLPASVLEAAE